MKLIFVILFLISSNAFALQATSLQTDFAAKLLPYVQQQGVRGHFIGVDDVEIQYLMIPAADSKGVIIISPGKGEPFMKYSEVMYDLRDLGYTIFIIDHRGQGYSERLLADPEKSHVERFDDYVFDFSQFVLDVIHPENYKTSFILAHSMGGAVAAGFMQKYPDAVTGAILSAPMFSINTGQFSEGVGGILANILNIFIGDQYAPNQKPFNDDELFQDSITTSSLERFTMGKELYSLFPEFRVGGSTVRWVKEALGYTEYIRQVNHVFQVPTLFFQAGNDQYVWPQGQNEICEQRSPQFCRIIAFPGSKHEILMESDAIRNQAFAQIRTFLTGFN